MMLRGWSGKFRGRSPEEGPGSPPGREQKQQQQQQQYRRRGDEDDLSASFVSIITPMSSPAAAVVEREETVAVARTPVDELREELGKEPMDERRVKNLLKSSLFRGKVPSELRSEVWKRLLGVRDEPEEDARLSEQIRSCPKDLSNQRVIRVDVERTRVDITAFREPATQDFLTQLLTYFCRSRNARYKQGLNEILAPFVYIQQRDGEFCKPGTEATVFKMWCAFIDRYLPHLYDDDSDDSEQMVALQCSFRFLEQLLLYHDPELWHLLDHNKLKPELYSSSWIMTMFAQSVPMIQVFQLWEAMLLGDGVGGDSLVVPFVALAFLCANRNTFLTADPSDLPVLLTSKLSYHRRTSATTPMSASARHASSFFTNSPSLIAGSDSLVLLSETLRHAIATANELRKHTPDLLLWELRTTLHNKDRPPTSRILSRLTNKLCATCSPEFFWMGLTGRLEDSTEIIVVDCRPVREFDTKRARARLVFNFGPEVMENPDKLSANLADLRRHVINRSDPMMDSNVPSSLALTWRWHICVVGEFARSLYDDDDVSDDSLDSSSAVSSDVDGISGMCILHLLKHSFPCVSVVEGGWEKVLERCPNRNKLLFPMEVASPSTEETIPLPSITSHKPHPAYRKHRASYGDAIEDFDGPSFIVSRSSRGTPVML